MEMEKKIRFEIKLIFLVLVIGLLLYGNYHYKWIDLSGSKSTVDNSKVLATYDDKTYTDNDFENDKKIFSAAYGVDLSIYNLSKEEFINATVTKQIIYSEAIKSDYNETFVKEYAVLLKDDYLKKSAFNETRYADNYKALGYTAADIDAFFFREALVSYYLELNLYSAVNITNTTVIDFYNTNIDGYTYNDSFYVFKMIVLDNDSLATDVYIAAKNYSQYFNITNPTAEQKNNMQNYFFSALIYDYSMDTNSKATNGVYYVEKVVPDDKPMVKFINNAVSVLTEYEISPVLPYSEDYLDEDNKTVTLKTYYIFERLPNTMPLMDVYDQIGNALYQTQRETVWTVYLNTLGTKHNLKFY